MELVRTTPLYFVPLAGLLLPLIDRRHWARSSLYLVLGLAVTIAPWSIRNSILYEAPMAVDDIAVFNFLWVHPNSEYVDASRFDLEKKKGRRLYRGKLKRANRDRELSAQSGRILADGLVDMALDPGKTLRTTAANGKKMFARFTRSDSRWIARTEDPCSVTRRVDSLNATYLAVMVLGLLGMALTARDRRTWPLLLWVAYVVLVVTVLFDPTLAGRGRLRLPIIPIMAVFAGAAVVRVTKGQGAESQEDAVPG